MQRPDQAPSPIAITIGALFSLWIGVMIAGVSLAFTPVIDPAAKPDKGAANKKDPKSTAGSTKKDDKKDGAPVAKTFAEGNLTAPFYTYIRGEEKSGSQWKALMDNITQAKGPSEFKETDLNIWTMSYNFKAEGEPDAMTIVPERAFYRIANGTMSISSTLGFAESKIPFTASGDFSGSNRAFKASSGRIGSCPLPGFLAQILLKKFADPYLAASQTKPLLDAWPKLRTVAVEGDTLRLVP